MTKPFVFADVDYHGPAWEIQAAERISQQLADIHDALKHHLVSHHVEASPTKRTSRKKDS